MLKYFRGYHRPTKINRNEYLTHEQFPHENFPIYCTCIFKINAIYLCNE